jgi:delta 1-pyrroline-5-carboxylate dehydrogenase
MSRALKAYSGKGRVLTDPSLLKTHAYIGGEWLDADDGATFQVYNPATHELISEVADVGVAETRRAIEAAAVVQKEWAAKSAVERSVGSLAPICCDAARAVPSSASYWR